METLKSKLSQKKLTIGSWINIGHTAVVEIMANAGFEWLTIDMEHSAITLDVAQQLIQVIELSGVAPLVRVGENNPALIKRVMDLGAHGVIVPMVNNKEDAVNAVNAVKYPPTGTRGVGLARAQGYGVSFESYKEWVEKESLVIVQIEHIKAIEHLEDILTVQGVDAFIVGPYDLSGSLGIPGAFDHPRFLSAVEEIRRVSKKMDLSAGFHVVLPTPELVQTKIEEGYTFIAYSVDFLFLGEMCRNGLRDIRSLVKEG
jgi:2-dehydro-3-deoxyglucarate aldolase